MKLWLTCHVTIKHFKHQCSIFVLMTLWIYRLLFEQPLCIHSFQVCLAQCCRQYLWHSAKSDFFCAQTRPVMTLLGQHESASSALINGANWTGFPAYLYNESPLFSAPPSPTPTIILKSIVHLQLGSELPSGNCITLTLFWFLFCQRDLLFIGCRPSLRL